MEKCWFSVVLEVKYLQLNVKRGGSLAASSFGANLHVYFTVHVRAAEAQTSLRIVKMTNNAYNKYRFLMKTGSHGRNPRGEGVRTPMKIHKNIGFPSNIDPDPLKITKLPSQHSIVCHYRHACETPLKWRFAGGPIMAHF